MRRTHEMILQNCENQKCQKKCKLFEISNFSKYYITFLCKNLARKNTLFHDSDYCVSLFMSESSIQSTWGSQKFKM